jgi:hypothetical protein
MSTLAQGLARALHALADDGEREPPVALLWPDPEGRQWERAFAPLRALLARERIALYQHATGDGSFAPDEGRGPSIWLHCLLDASLPGASPPRRSLPVLLLPGIASRDLKSPLTLRQELQPLVELPRRATGRSQPSCARRRKGSGSTLRSIPIPMKPRRAPSSACLTRQPARRSSALTGLTGATSATFKPQRRE